MEGLLWFLTKVYVSFIRNLKQTDHSEIKSPFYCEYSNIVLDTVQVKLRTALLVKP